MGDSLVMQLDVVVTTAVFNMGIAQRIQNFLRFASATTCCAVEHDFGVFVARYTLDLLSNLGMRNVNGLREMPTIPFCVGANVDDDHIFW